jgi:hypothetical protein
MKSIILLLLIIGSLFIMYGYMKSFYKPEPPETEIRYIRRSVFNEQHTEEVNEKFKPLFEEKSPYII